MLEKADNALREISKRYALLHMKRSCDALNKCSLKNRNKVLNVLKRFAKVIPKTYSPEKKAALIYQVLTSEITYDWKNMDTSAIPFTFIGALCGRRAVCMGIAELYTLLCRLSGVNAITVIGYASGAAPDSDGLHAWNLVQLSDRRYYHADPTWDLHTSASDWEPDWFLLSDSQMTDHYWLKEDYPKARKNYDVKIDLDQKGVSLLCLYWRRLTAEFQK